MLKLKKKNLIIGLTIVTLISTAYITSKTVERKNKVFIENILKNSVTKFNTGNTEKYADLFNDDKDTIKSHLDEAINKYNLKITIDYCDVSKVNLTAAEVIVTKSLNSFINGKEQVNTTREKLYLNKIKGSWKIYKTEGLPLY